MKKIIKGMAASGIAIIYLGITVLGLILHLWTILISFQEKGMLSALITLVCPVLAQIYWFFYVAGRTGSYFTNYAIGLYVLIGSFVIAILLSMFVTKNE